MDNNIKYQLAKKRVKQIKGFYIHVLVFILVNLLNYILKFHEHGYIKLNDVGFSGLWFLGLVIHGLGVFLPNFIFGSNWEEKKIRELMEKDKFYNPKN